MESYSQVSPCKPVAAYLGSKSKLADRLVTIIDQIPHQLYAEVFIGMASVFLRRWRRPDAEVINDRNSEVANLFRILQRHYVQFMDVLKWQLTTRADFARLLATNPTTLTDLERAARFLYLQKTAFGGKTTGQSFGTSKSGGARFDITKLTSILEDVHERLSSVVIENLNYADLITTYDGPDTLFYMDPPYYGCEKDYGKDLFNRDQFALMAEQLSKIEGTFILSLNDHPEVRQIFKNYRFLSVETTYTIAGGENSMAAPEVIISNFKGSMEKMDLFSINEH